MTKINFNFTDIKSQAKDIIRMASNDHPQVNNYYSRYVENFKDFASYSELQLVRAKWDRFKNEEQLLYKSEISPMEFLDKCKKIKHGFQNLEKMDSSKILRESIFKQHPKTWMHRWAILNLLQESFHINEKLPLSEKAPLDYFSHLNPTNNCKKSKKMALRILKFFNKVR